jgi:hypothetical protein
MNNKFSRILVLALAGPCLLLAKDRSEKRTEQEEPKMISLSDFAKGIEIGMPMEQLTNTIIECAQGTELPVKMTIQGDMLSLEPNLFTIKLLKTCYIKSGKGPLLFSSDLKKWQKFADYFVGKTAASLNFQDQFAQINLELELNQRKNRWEAPLVQRREPRCKEVYIHNWSPYCPENTYEQPLNSFSERSTR